MRTIGHRVPSHIRRGDSVAMCDVCGVHWYRSQLVRDMDGLLRCPDELPGLSTSAQDLLFAEWSREATERIVSYDEGLSDLGYYDRGTADDIYITTAEGIEDASVRLVIPACALTDEGSVMADSDGSILLDC